MDPLLSALTGFGLPGLVVAVLLLALRQKDQELRASEKARIEEAKEREARLQASIERIGARLEERRPR